MNDMKEERLGQKIYICRWKYDAPFAYSITYDEGFIEVLANAFPIHEKFNIPGHINVVVGQIGEKRHAYGSTLNNFFHMSLKNLEYLVSKGWGIGNHSWSHFVYPCQPGIDLYKEVVWSKYRLEEILNYPIRVFALPNDSYNYLPVLSLVKKYYLACVNIEGSPNRESFDLFNIGNYILGSGSIPVRVGWPEELKTKNLDFDFLLNSWLYETTHLVRWNVPQPSKNITPEYLNERFEKLINISAGKIWAAKPDDVIDYELMRRNIAIDNVRLKNKSLIFDVEGKWPNGIINGELTVKVPKMNFKKIINIRKKYRKSIPEAFREKSYLHSNINSIVINNSDCLVTLELVPGETVIIEFE
jgi:peptidoglycan/xylan/chitin deacetylase (PgdA/CDA1 family)